jgi:hypothetical protein
VGEHFHVPGDTADVRAIGAIMAPIEGVDGPRWLVRSGVNTYFVIWPDTSLRSVRFQGALVPFA